MTEPQEPKQEPSIDIKALVAEMRGTVQALEQERTELQARVRAYEEEKRASALVEPPREKLTEAEVPVEALEAFIDAKIEQGVQRGLATALEPWQRAAQAAAAIDPDLAPGVQKFLRENPSENERYTRMLRADPDAAADYINFKLGTAKAKSSVVSKEEKQEASIVRGAESTPAAPETAETRSARREALLKMAQKNFDSRFVASELFKGAKVWRPGADKMEELS